jgi:cyclic-di-GMP-binding protein
MPLSLSIPVSTRTLPKEIETAPKKARVWAESLPLTQVIDSSRKLAEVIEAINRGKLLPEERYALVEVYRPTMNVLLDELQAIFAYATLPLPPKQKEAFDLSQHLLVESSYTYKMFILEKTSKLIGFGNKRSLPLPIHRTMQALQSMMMQCYKTYHPVGVGLWQEMHALYQYADEQGFSRDDVADMKSNISDVYFESLMLAMADPYRLMPKEADRVLDVLQQNRGLVELRLTADGIDPSRCYVVAFDSDAGPKALAVGDRPAPGNVLRLIEPSRLVERLESRIKTASANATSRAVHDQIDLMTRLNRLWGDPPRRQTRRSEADTAVALCAGIKAIGFFADLALNENPEADAEAIREGRTTPVLKIPQDPMSQLIGVEEWQVMNQSANGLRLHRRQGGSVAVTVGEAVGIRFVGGRAWNVGIVRWLTLLEGNALEFGVELISPAAISATILPTVGTGMRPMPAVLLASAHPEVLPDTVIAIVETYADLREYEINDHEEIRTVRATQLIERTSRFDMFQFQPSSDLTADNE